MERVLKQNFTIDYSYNVYFTEDLFDHQNNLLKAYFTEKINPNFTQKILFVIDQLVWDNTPELGDKIKSYFSGLSNIELIPEPLLIFGGEHCKNDSASLDSIIESINKNGVDRHSYVVAIGGGAILDLVGYAAAISHRGIKHIRIPTTVLSQNDSGVGVKNSVNYKNKKNFLGTFAPPIAVFNDFTFLTSLDNRSWLSGISEAIKVALIKDKGFYEWIVSEAQKLSSKDPYVMKELIFRCAGLHLEHIRSGDPFELGSSRPLDFGHWSAHKLEQMTNFKLLHGEAVAIGIAIDVMYSYLLGNLTEEEALSVVRLIHKIGLPIYDSILSTSEGKEQLINGLIEFQEHLGGRLTIVLLEKIGLGKDFNEINHVLMLDAIDYLHDLHNQYKSLNEVC